MLNIPKESITQYSVKNIEIAASVVWDCRCYIPECENSTEQHLTPPWLAQAVPSTAHGHDNCHRYAASNSSPPTYSLDSCPSILFNHDIIEPCDAFVYENKNTIVYDVCLVKMRIHDGIRYYDNCITKVDFQFGMACSEWWRSMIGSVRMLGMMLAMPLVGFVSDLRGRRSALLISEFFKAFLGITRYFANSYTYFIISEFLEGALASGSFSCIYIICK